ncbi:hypothetical protein Patl1_05264 [Pistacia atlantica]|uniref:Uncharacterized protein n=1 Tax=Pistacia atlantica TaxID=434234 RepID=A0ACC1BQ80_9ROSI|nr:hypothetical protein Patl1_05264 [Pistacia atlantica]
MLNPCKLLYTQVLHFCCTLAQAYLILSTLGQLWEVYNISCSPALTLLSLDFNSTMTVPSLYMSSLMRIG